MIVHEYFSCKSMWPLVLDVFYVLKLVFGNWVGDEAFLHLSSSSKTIYFLSLHNAHLPLRTNHALHVFGMFST